MDNFNRSGRSGRKAVMETTHVITVEPLTKREVEVLCFIAQTGSSNEEIAGELVISIKTVENHIGNILGKLRVDSRIKAALWAIQNHLAVPKIVTFPDD